MGKEKTLYFRALNGNFSLTFLIIGPILSFYIDAANYMAGPGREHSMRSSM